MVSPAVEEESAMVAISVMTAVCVVGVAFYVRFLVALVNDRKRYHPSNYLVCLRASCDEHMLADDEEYASSVSPAA